MYTQCPDCDTAFRVTAPDLQRDSGRVICIGCSREFNALERLSEDPPATEERADEKRAILESLNELTGPHEIRIEDTGVEWRVVDEDDLAEEEPSPPVESESGGDEDSSLRWYIADLADELAGDDPAPDDAVAETPVTGPGAGSGAGPAPEPNDSAPLEPSPGEQKISILQESLELPGTVSDGDVQRYDDNTPLPDDLVDEGEPRVPQRRAEDRIEPRSPEADEAQVDLALGEPEEWMELLGEVGPSADDATPASAGLVPTDQALSNVDTLADTDVRPVSDDELPLDDGYPSDIDTQFDLQAIELGIDLTGSRNLSLEDEAEEHDEPLRLETDEPEGGFAETREQDLATAKAQQDEQMLPTAPPALAVEDPAVGAAVVEAGEWPGPTGSTARRGDEDEERTREEAFELELAAAYSITSDGEDDGGPDDPAQTEPAVPPATEEEMTVNLMIDQDLIKLAEQQNVFTSTAARRKPDAAPHVETIIMEGDFVRSVLDGDEESWRDPGAGAFADPDGRIPAQPDDADLTLKAHSKSRDRVRGGHRGTDIASYSVMAGVAVLGLVLAAQVVHAYRNTLATYPIFDSTVGSVYRMLGEPVVPGWNVTEWRFEATSGSTDDTDEVLTISSRIANGSAKPLPYPLLHVSLTDRWEEIIGSKVLEPAEYLAGSGDAAARVSPGETFTAVIRVEAPAPEATGFKLNVCYPDSGDRVRCATEDFRD